MEQINQIIVLTRSFLALPDLISRAAEVREAGSTDLVRAPRLPGPGEDGRRFFIRGSTTAYRSRACEPTRPAFGDNFVEASLKNLFSHEGKH